MAQATSGSKPQASNTANSDDGPNPGARLIVAIGASAGGLEALEKFFDHMPTGHQLAFVVVTHVPSGRVSLLPELLSSHTRMKVVPVTGPTQLAPDHVYVAGERELRLDGDTLTAVAPTGGPGRPVIDGFFRSLAREARERAVGVVLSGTGSDGTVGIKEIKAAGGMTMAQEEASARFSSMPHSAIASMQVDYVLPPSEMPAQLVSYAAVAGRGHILNDPAPTSLELVGRLFALMRARTGHDFSHYKGSTIGRRIERRMNVHQIESLQDYLQFLNKNPAEVDHLFKELLIGVTSFFRDPEAHELLLARFVPQVLEGKPDGHTVRAWVAGCSTGEEAYSLAITMREAIERARVQSTVQIFATDLDPEAIEVARTGEYPESIAADVSAERLERYFTHEEGFYRIRKEVRESLVFAPHSLIQDPPFTKLDLLSCRNLLIYLESKIQQQLMPVFHYSLRPGGLLVLGSSETVGQFGHLFESLDKKWKIFRRKEVPSGSYVADMPTGSSDFGPREPIVAVSNKTAELTIAQSAERALLQHLLPPTVVMHERGDVVHIHGRTGMFLEPSPGPQTSANVYNMAREGLSLDLAVAVRSAAANNESVVRRGVKVKTNGHYIAVDLRVKKLHQPEHMRGLFLVSFERARPVESDEAPAAPDDVKPENASRLNELERELQHAKEIHQSTVEELETANEKLQATNEELQSTNEELQSANEELETSKEEMQSLNEELQTVNAELHGKIEELSRANDDMKNLLNGTDIATIFLDNDLNIKRYTEQAKRVIRLISSDVGRPIGDLVSKLRYATLVEDATEVLHSLVFKEAEVQSENGEASYLMRMLPYRTADNVIDGLVITFVDVTMVKELQEQTRRLVGALHSSPVGIFGHSLDLRYQWAFGTIFGQAADQVVGRKDEELFREHAEEIVALKRAVVERRAAIRRELRVGATGKRGAWSLFVQPAFKNDGELRGVDGVLVQLDAVITGQKLD